MKCPHNEARTRATAKANEAPHPLDRDSLEFAIFEKVRRTGADRADGKTVWHNGKEYGLTVNTISTFKTVHVVIEHLDEGGIQGHQRAMAIVDVVNNGYLGGPNGSSLLLTALIDGVRVAAHPGLTRSYHVLPILEVPPIFQKHQAGETD